MTAYERDLDAEELLTGFLLNDRHTEAVGRLRPEDFTGDCAPVFAAARAARAAGGPVTIATVLRRMHADARPRLRALAADAVDVLALYAKDLVDRIERCRHRRVVGCLIESLTQLADSPNGEFDCGLQSLMDAGLPRIIGLLTRAGVRVRRPVCTQRA